MYDDRFIEMYWAKVDVRNPDECWSWKHSTNGGYGLFFAGGKRYHAHRLAWELANGQPFPEGLYGCHACDNPGCVNPAHIWPGTIRDNAQDMIKKGRSRWKSKECPKGHPYTGQNLGYRKCRNYTSRYCRTCFLEGLRIQGQKRRARRRAESPPKKQIAETAARAIISNAKAAEIRAEYYAGGATYRSLSTKHGLTKGTINKLLSDRSYRVPEAYPDGVVRARQGETA